MSTPNSRVPRYLRIHAKIRRSSANRLLPNAICVIAQPVPGAITHRKGRVDFTDCQSVCEQRLFIVQHTAGWSFSDRCWWSSHGIDSRLVSSLGGFLRYDSFILSLALCSAQLAEITLICFFFLKPGKHNKN